MANDAEEIYKGKAKGGLGGAKKYRDPNTPPKKKSAYLRRLGRMLNGNKREMA